jgi:hypothetical protein
LATFRQYHGDPSAALQEYRHAHQIFLELFVADQKNSLAKSNFGFSDSGIAKSLIAMGKPAAAVKVYREAVATFEGMSPAASSNRYVRTGLADSYSGLGDAYSAWATEPRTSPDLARERWRAACSWYVKSSGVWSDKDKRRELESDEPAESRLVTEAIAKCDRALQTAKSARNPHSSNSQAEVLPSTKK